MIASGNKTIEVRSWPCKYRGLLVICAGGGGGAVAVVEIVDCVPFVASHDAASGGVWSKFERARAGHHAWMLRLVRRVSSDVIKGKLSFFDVAESGMRDA
jgi:hypothetical protein